MSETDDNWRQLSQCLPKSVYDELMAGLRRIALANGISADAFSDDDKSKQTVGPRVCVWELLTILIRETGDRGLRL
jgi:hypothetical protein